MVVKPQSVTLNLTLGATSEKILNADPGRNYALITNSSAVQCYFAFGRPATANDHPLNASGGSYEINALAPWKGELWILGNTATIAVTSW